MIVLHCWLLIIYNYKKLGITECCFSCGIEKAVSVPWDSPSKESVAR